MMTGTDASRGVRMDGSASRLTVFVHDAQAVEAPVLVKVFYGQRGNFRAAEAYLGGPARSLGP